MEQVKKVSKLVEFKSLSKSFTGTVKQVLGTWYLIILFFNLIFFNSCSLGCTVEGENPKNIIEKIKNGELTVE